ncbi:MAG: hypothetical protein ACTJFN_00795 [Sphingobacterium sp.]
MKTFIYFCITSMFSAGALLATLSMSNPWPVWAVVVAAWVLFIWGVGKRDREEQRRREREDLFDEWLRSQSRGGRHY